MKNIIFRKLKSVLPLLFYCILFVILLLLPTGYEDAIQYQGMDRTTARVLSVDNSMLLQTGLIQSGEQKCDIKLLGGRFRGLTTEGI